ncbi:diacylglycerol/lipid kinase family protein [Henriciella aquimarina]|uniref:diacylglycerol/lipid kinase family protein n=1 Tax=Henriciella aquimarina TaxID=545261 RepID=UPI000A054F9E|nr:diacylglycerol kinase family protein [Henriciella aquimarina]
MSLAVLINPRSGSVPADAEEKLRTLLDELSEPCEITWLDKEDICTPIDACFATAPDAVIVWGGDGTVACALERAGEDGPPILPLPGGTMNLFHKQIHGGPCDWDECLRRGLTEGRLIDVPAGCAGDRRFYVAAMAGNLTDLAGPREALREGHVLEAIERLSGSDMLDMSTGMSFTAADSDGRPQDGYATAAAIFVGPQDQSDFEFAYINPDNSIELVAAGVGALFSDWRQATGVTTLHVNDVRLSHQRGYELRVTLDGEPVRLKSGTRFHRIAKAGRAISAQCE